jgi:hypothetical protein
LVLVLASRALETIPTPDIGSQTIINMISGWFSGIVTTLIGDIISPIIRAVQWAASVAINWAYDSIAQVWAVLNEVASVGGDVFGWVENQISPIYDAINAAFDHVLGIAQQAYDWITGADAWLWQRIQDVIGLSVETFIAPGGWLLKWLNDNLLQPILDQISTLTWWAQNIGSWIIEQIATQVQWLVQGWFAVGGWLYGIVQQIVSDTIGASLDVISGVITVVQGAWNFLVWVAAHPLSWFEDQLTAAEQAGEDWLAQHVLAALDASSGTVEDWVAAHL